MTPPQPRGLIPTDEARRLTKARDARKGAEAEFRAAVLAALKAGGSIREVAALAEVSTRTVQNWQQTHSATGSDEEL